MKINSSISSPNILRWDSSTCDPFTLTCTRTHGRIPTSCRNDEMMKEACAKICGSAYECQDQTCYAQLLLYLTLIGRGGWLSPPYSSNIQDPFRGKGWFCCYFRGKKHPNFHVLVLHPTFWLAILIRRHFIWLGQQTSNQILVNFLIGWLQRKHAA